MGVIETLRDAEEAGRKAAILGADLVRTGIQNAESSVRGRVKGHRSRTKAPLSVSTHADPEQEQEASPAKVRTGIVSINGQDIGEMRCTGGRRSA